MPFSEHRCPVGLCRSRVDDPLVPCGECMVLFGQCLRPAAREVCDEEVSALLARSEAKAARAVGPVPARPLRARGNRRPAPAARPALSGDELDEEAVHLVWWCGFSREEAASRLGVSRLVLDAALRRSEAAA